MDWLTVRQLRPPLLIRPMTVHPNANLALLGSICAQLCIFMHGDNGLILLPNLTPFI